MSSEQFIITQSRDRDQDVDEEEEESMDEEERRLQAEELGIRYS